jgi:hypothetical protein
MGVEVGRIAGKGRAPESVRGPDVAFDRRGVVVALAGQRVSCAIYWSCKCRSTFLRQSDCSQFLQERKQTNIVSTRIRGRNYPLLLVSFRCRAPFRFRRDLPPSCLNYLLYSFRRVHRILRVLSRTQRSLCQQHYLVFGFLNNLGVVANRLMYAAFANFCCASLHRRDLLAKYYSANHYHRAGLAIDILVNS